MVVRTLMHGETNLASATSALSSAVMPPKFADPSKVGGGASEEVHIGALEAFPASN